MMVPPVGGLLRALVIFGVVIGLLLAAVIYFAATAMGQIPARSALYRIDLTRQAQAQFGLQAPVARFAAQIHQESSWRPNARSKYAAGLTQFTPSTARWISEQYPQLAANDPLDPHWSIPAMITYDKHIYTRRRDLWSDECSAWAGTMSEYNGGFKYLSIEIGMAAASVRHDAQVWIDNVEMMRARGERAYRENRDYPRRILLDLEQRYIRAGWTGEAVCHDM